MLIVDDEAHLLRLISRIATSAGFETRTASNAELAIAAVRERVPDIVLADLVLPGMSGLDLLAALGNDHPEVSVVVMSGLGSISAAVDAMRAGAVDFVEKPVVPDRLLLALERALERSRLRDRHQRLQEDLTSGRRLIGSSPAMTALRKQVQLFAASDARVLILGENGTGKELVASAIHTGSRRRDQPYIRMNSAAVPDNLLESELFGHERGAFTGALHRRLGRFELAHRGTLFLDEIGDMPLAMQAKILRVLQEGEFERVGGQQPVRADVRVVAATHRDVERAVARGEFREDLYFRLAVATIRVPPLRERLEDLPELVATFSGVGGRGHGARFSRGALAELEHYDFPGNVRELQNLVERLTILAGDGEVDAALVRAELPRGAAQAARWESAARGPNAPEVATRSPLEELERERVVDALRTTGGRKAEAAELLGISRVTLWRRLRQLGLAR